MTEPEGRHRFDPFPGEAICRHCEKGARAKVHSSEPVSDYRQETT